MGQRTLFLDILLFVVFYLALAGLIIYLVPDKETRDLAVQVLPGLALFVAPFVILHRSSGRAATGAMAGAGDRTTAVRAMNVGTAFLFLIVAIVLAWGWQVLSMEAFQVELARHVAAGELKLATRADQALQFVAAGLFWFCLVPAVLAAAAWVGVRQPAAGFTFFLLTMLSTLGVVGAITAVHTVTKGGQAVDVLAVIFPALVSGSGEPRERAFVAMVQAGVFVAVIIVPTLLMWLSALTARRLAGEAAAKPPPAAS